MFGVRVRECSNVWGRVREFQVSGAPMFGVRVRECSNVWG